MANALPPANYVSNGVAVRWPTNEAAAVAAAASTRAALHQVVQQQTIPPQQNPNALVAGQATERHQAYYPTASMALSYPHKFPVRLHYVSLGRYSVPLMLQRRVAILRWVATILLFFFLLSFWLFHFDNRSGVGTKNKKNNNNKKR